MNILDVRQDFEDASGSKQTRVLHMAGLYIQGLHRVPNIFDYGSTCLNNA